MPDTEIQVAAAAITAAISPPLGVAVAAGSALRSARVRGALRKGTVQALSTAMQVGDHLTAAAAAAARGRDAGSAGSGEPARGRAPDGHVAAEQPKRGRSR